MPTYADQPLIVGDTVLFGLLVKLNDLAWDITGATVSLYLRDPSGNWSAALSASVVDGPNGQAQYQGSTSLLDEAGPWLRQWKIDDAGNVKYSDQIEFDVEPGPG